MDGASLSAAASTLASLLVIFLLLAGAAFLLRLLRAKLPGGVKTQGAISIIASHPLGGQHALMIAEVEGVRFLIGVSRDSMTAIGRLGTHD